MNINLNDIVTDEYVVCLESGKKMKTLKRHLNTYYNLSEKEYISKWGLPQEFAITTCKNLSNTRKAIAKEHSANRVIKIKEKKANKKNHSK